MRHHSSQPSITYSDHDLQLNKVSSHSPVRMSLYRSSDALPPHDPHGRRPSDASTVLDGSENMPTPTAAYYTPVLGGDLSGPFNFQPTSMAKSPVIKSNISARRGHKYKHSSVSLPPAVSIATPTRPPLTLPNSLPIPTFKEFRASLTMNQRLRLAWSVIHMLIAAYTAWNAHSSSSLESLSHLLFYDSLGALLCVLVEGCSNFDVWGRSSIRHPFGLQRIEVIAGFALSVLLIFFGFDLISHNAKHALEGIGKHVPHRSHHHESSLTNVAASVDFTVLLALLATLISAVGLQNHARIGRAMRFAAMDNLPFPLDNLLSNPSHFLTLSCSLAILILPLLDLHTYETVDKLLSLTTALSMLFLGTRLGTSVGAMLLMSYPGRDIDSTLQAITADPLVLKLDTARIWQAHYGVALANIRIRVAPTSDESALIRLRERVVSLIRNKLGGGYGRVGVGVSRNTSASTNSSDGTSDDRTTAQKWEVSVELQQEAQAQAHSHGHQHQHGEARGHSHGHAHQHTAHLHKFP